LAREEGVKPLSFSSRKRDNRGVADPTGPRPTPWIQERTAIGLVVGGIGPIVLAGALVGVRGEIDSANVALLLVLVVLAAGVVGGRVPGAVGAIVGALSFDFFHTKPYESLTIASRDDVETTILLLVVGLVAGQIAVRARRNRSLATERRSEIHQLHRVAELVARGASRTEVEQAVCEELRQLLALRDCWYEPEPSARVFPRLERNGAIAADKYRHTGHEGFALPADGVELPVFGGGRSEGRLILQPDGEVGVSLDRRLVAVAIADQLGAALSSRPVRKDT
jgi:K+-sensing histidine kinase KdpD